jgi:PQQ-dependent catabolism-associated CXXCW motif protein
MQSDAPTRPDIRPEIRFAGRFRLATLLAGAGLLLCGPGMAEEHVDPKSMTPPAATGEVTEPSDYRTTDYRMPVPRTLKGATVVNPDEAEKLMAAKAAVFIDVYPRAPKPPNLPAGTIWRDVPHASIAGAHWLPNVGYGVLSPEFETYFKTRLEALTGKDKAAPVVFFCLKDCWMSWNAAKRAQTWGYSAVHWFPEGTDGWQAIGNDLVSVTPVP